MAKNLFTFHSLVRQTLRAVGKPLTAEEIWDHARRLELDKKLRKPPGKTPWATIAAQIYTSMKNDPASPYIKVGRRPVRLFLKDLAEKVSPKVLEEQASRPEESTQRKLLERDLHPLLVYFAQSQLSVHCKTIRHEKSNKTKKSEWLHPDLVGLYIPADIWEAETLTLSRELGAAVARLYAFELKTHVDFSNLRESFFQAVSNASWANEGYLTAARFSADAEFEAELKRLSDAFGIGVLRLDIDDPDSSEIVYRSRQRSELDWETINKLAGLNPDFVDFMKAVHDSLKIHRVNTADFDQVPSDADSIAKRLASSKHL